MIGVGAFVAGIVYSKIGYSASSRDVMLLIGSAAIAFGGLVDLMIVGMRTCDQAIWGKPSR
jgi:hypothetical protein